MTLKCTLTRKLRKGSGKREFNIMEIRDLREMEQNKEIAMLRLQISQLNGVVSYLLERVCINDYGKAEMPVDKNPNYVRIITDFGFLYALNPNRLSQLGQSLEKTELTLPPPQARERSE